MVWKSAISPAAAPATGSGMHEASEGIGGMMLTFGTNASDGVDIHGLAALPSTNIVWA
jgi:hypothetical protein